MRFKEFPLNRFLYKKEESDKKVKNFILGKTKEIPVIMRGSNQRYKGMERNAEELLESQLEDLNGSLEIDSDFIFPGFLQPWYGTDIYAVAYGCSYKWYEGLSPQSESYIKKIEDISSFKKADIENCELMRLILDTIRYMKEKTGNTLDISVTDTQSPNDIGSEIMDTCEFIAMCALEPDIADAYLTDITNTVIKFTETQIDAIGDNVVFPGHVMISHKDVKGVYLSDDNMAYLSPAVYKNACLKFNNIISKHFGSVSIHSCGNWVHNAKLLLETENLFMVDCSMGKGVDPCPLNPAEIRDNFKGSNTIVKAKIGVEELENLRKLYHPDLRLVVELVNMGSSEEKKQYYHKTKEFINHISD